MYTSCLILDREAFENNVPSGTHHFTDKLALKRVFKSILERTLGVTLVCKAAPKLVLAYIWALYFGGQYFYVLVP